MSLRIFACKMSQNAASKLVINAEKAEKRLTELKNKLEQVKKFKVDEKIKELTQENESLMKKVEAAKIELIRLESLHGKKQYSLPGKTGPETYNTNISNSELISTNDNEVPFTKKEKKQKAAAKKSKETPDPTQITNLVDVRKLDIRVGKIVGITKHPEADTQYVVKVDCGEDTPRTVIAGLVNYIPIEELKDRFVTVLCNLKPMKVRGVASEAMIMCACTDDTCELLVPPNGAGPGDHISCEGYPREPDAQLNPKKKIFETCAPDLKTNDDCIACYKDSPLLVPGKGPVSAASLKRAQLK